ncbi:unnamed protein product [Heterobilharzia americana]|nr:unnamed protein product [Heterobilharzia americana]
MICEFFGLWDSRFILLKNDVDGNIKKVSRASNNLHVNTLYELLANETNRDDSSGSNNSIGQETSAVAPVGNDQSVLKHWINQLETEIKRFKVENANLNKLKIEVQNNLRQIELEKNCFINNKMKEQKEFEEYKEAEIKKLKKEKRVLEEYRRALRTMPNKKDREEIERLKQELEESRTDMGKREVRWHSALSRLRTRIEELETERDELKSRISKLEEDRISLQSRLAKLQISSNTSNPSRQRSSSLRQTINSISQSISLAPSVNGTNLKTTSDTYHRSRQPPCTRSSSSTTTTTLSRPVSRLSSNPDRYGTMNGHMIMSTNQKQIYSNKPCQQECSSSIVSGTRESLTSGNGYFTGDDDCSSVGGSSGRVIVKFLKQKTLSINCIVIGQEKLPIPGTAASGTLIRSVKHTDGSIEQTYSNGAVVVSYANGSVKEIFPDATTVIVSLFNGDIKRTLPDGRVIYHYAADGTVQTTFPNGTEEILFADGRQEIIHSNVKTGSSNGLLSMTIPANPSKCLINEQVCRRLSNGDKEILLPNGQREIHSSSGIKCRIYPDGTTKTVFPDGRQETRYSSGRLRVKDANGNLLLDTRLPVTTYHPALNANLLDVHIPNGFYNNDSGKISTANLPNENNTTMKSNS